MTTVNSGDVLYINSSGMNSNVVPLLAYDDKITPNSVLGPTSNPLAGLGFAINGGSGGMFSLDYVKRWNTDGGTHDLVTGPINYRDTFIIRSLEVESALRREYELSMAAGATISNGMPWYININDMAKPNNSDDIVATLQYFGGGTNISSVQITATSKHYIDLTTPYRDLHVAQRFFFQKIGASSGSATGPVSYGDTFAIVALCPIVGTESSTSGCKCGDEYLPAWVAPPNSTVVKLIQDSAVKTGTIDWDDKPVICAGSISNYCDKNTPLDKTPIPCSNTGTLKSEYGGPTSFTWSVTKYQYNPNCEGDSEVMNAACSIDPSQSSIDSGCKEGVLYSGCSLSNKSSCLAGIMQSVPKCFSNVYMFTLTGSSEIVWLFGLPSGMWFMNSDGTVQKIETPTTTPTTLPTSNVYGKEIATPGGYDVFVTVDGYVFEYGTQWTQLIPVLSAGTDISGVSQYLGPPDPYGGPRFAYARYPPMPGMTLPCVPAGSNAGLADLSSNLCNPTDPTIGGLYTVGIRIKNWSPTSSIQLMINGSSYIVAAGATSDVISTSPPVPGSPPFSQFECYIVTGTGTTPLWSQGTSAPFVLPSFRSTYSTLSTPPTPAQPIDDIINIDPEKKYIQGYYTTLLGSGSSNATVRAYFDSKTSSVLAFQQEKSKKHDSDLLTIMSLLSLGIIAFLLVKK